MPRSNATPDTHPTPLADVFDFFASDETTTIYLEPPSRDPSYPQLWVRLLNELDFGQQSELDAASLRGMTVQAARNAVETGAQDQQLMVFDLGHQRRLKLSLYIDDWSLPHRWPSKLDERYQLVKRLKPRWATMILSEIEKLEAKAAGEHADGAEPRDVLAGEPDPNGSLPVRVIESAPGSR